MITIPIQDCCQDMPSLFPSRWSKRAVEEVRILSTGLFYVGILIRAISILGFDSRPVLPTPLALNWDIVSFVAFLVRHDKHTFYEAIDS